MYVPNVFLALDACALCLPVLPVLPVLLPHTWLLLVATGCNLEG